MAGLAPRLSGWAKRVAITLEKIERSDRARRRQLCRANEAARCDVASGIALPEQTLENLRDKSESLGFVGFDIPIAGGAAQDLVHRHF